MRDNVKIVPYESAHVIAWDSVYKNWAEMHHKTPGDAYSIFVDGTFVVAGGIHPMSERVGSVWMFTTVNLKGNIRKVYPLIKRFLDNGMRVNNYHRLQATVVFGNVLAERFIEHLGFHCETPEGMERFTDDGVNHKLYARVI